ncbi:MAG: PEP-CTERM sorting domain-containing protein, partial [Rariglobus sp.]
VLTLSGTTVPSGTGIPTGMSATPSISGNATISATLAGSQGFIFSGGNRTLTLSGNNIYTGLTTLTNGNLTIRSANALGATGTGSDTVVSRGDSGQFPQLHLANNVNTNEAITLRLGYSSGTAGATVGDNGLLINDNGSNSTIGGTLTLQRATNGGVNNIYLFRVHNTSTLNLTGDISGSLSGTEASGNYGDQNQLVLQSSHTTAVTNFNVSGAISDGTIGRTGISVYTSNTSNGIIRLSGSNTYSGSTVHQSGTLLINNVSGSGTGTGSVRVLSPVAVTGNVAAVFGGTGIVAPGGSNSILFGSGTTVAPGDVTDANVAISNGAALTFNLAGTTGSATFEAGSIIALNLNANLNIVESLAFTGLGSDLTSRVHFNNNTVNFSVTGSSIAPGLYTIATFDGLYDGQWVLGTGLSAYNASLIHNANSIQLLVSAIPEPSTAAMLIGLAALGYVTLGKRRRV